MALSLSSLEIARKSTILRLEFGEMQEVLTKLTALIESVDVSTDPRLVQSLYYLYQDRATVLRRVNRWKEALADLNAAEGLLGRMAPIIQPLGRIAVAHARALLLSDPFNPRAEEVEALRQIEIARAAGASRLSCRRLQEPSRIRSGRWRDAATAARSAARARGRGVVGGSSDLPTPCWRSTS